jgi:CHASE3 domain sensor protein
MHRDMRIRNRLILILLLPATLFLFAVGWLLYSLGERRLKPPQQAEHTTTKEDKMEIHIAVTEEPEEYTN